MFLVFSSVLLTRDEIYKFILWRMKSRWYRLHLFE